MPYDMQQTREPTASADLQGGSEVTDGGGDTGQDETIHIQSDMLPSGIKEGDMLKCTGQDENGCQFELVKGDIPETAEDWETGFRKEMSATRPTQEAS